MSPKISPLRKSFICSKVIPIIFLAFFSTCQSHKCPDFAVTTICFVGFVLVDRKEEKVLLQQIILKWVNKERMGWIRLRRGNYILAGLKITSYKYQRRQELWIDNKGEKRSWQLRTPERRRTLNEVGQVEWRSAGGPDLPINPLLTSHQSGLLSVLTASAILDQGLFGNGRALSRPA